MSGVECKPLEPEAKPPVTYLLVRKDLPINVQMVQAAHAAQECVREAPVSKRTVLRLLWVENEEELCQYAFKLEAKNFAHDLVFEPDEPYLNAAMALGTAPIVERQSALAKIFFHLKRVNFEQ